MFWRLYFQAIVSALPSEEAISRIREIAMSYRTSQGTFLIRDAAWGFLENEAEDFTPTYAGKMARASNLRTIESVKGSVFQAYMAAADLTENVAEKVKAYKYAGISAAASEDQDAAKAAVGELQKLALGGKEIETVEYFICVASIMGKGSMVEAKELVDAFEVRYPNSQLVNDLRKLLSSRERSRPGATK